jgi:hypothetical protein
MVVKLNRIGSSLTLFRVGLLTNSTATRRIQLNFKIDKYPALTQIKALKVDGNVGTLLKLEDKFGGSISKKFKFFATLSRSIHD